MKLKSILLLFITLLVSSSHCFARESRIAFVDPRVFSDSDKGIARLVNAIGNLDGEFSPLSDDMKKEQISVLRAITYGERQVALSSYGKRLKEVVSPIYADIYEQLEEYSRQRGITLLLDLSRTSCLNDQSMKQAWNITQDFISEYNRLNPANAPSNNSLNPTPQ